MSDFDDALPSAIGLEYEFSYFARLKEPFDVGAVQFGNRVVAEVTDGKVEGKRISGDMLSGGADWLLVGADGFGTIDVRVQVRTHDGANIFMSYVGHIEVTSAVQGALAGEEGSSAFDAQYFRTTPRLECGDPRYAWVNRTVFVAEGRIRAPRTVEYRVHRVL